MAEGRFDIVVVGGGIVGATAAFCLARRGAKVALVERDRIAGGTTSRSFAWINATSKVADEAYHRLNAKGGRLYKELAEEFGAADLGLFNTGMLQCVSRSHAAGHAAMLEQAAYLKRYGYPCRLIGAEELRALEPRVVFEDDVEAIFATADDWLDAPRFARFLAAKLRAMGSTVFEGSAARRIEMTDDGAVAGIATDQDLLGAPEVLVAAGPDTPEVLSDLTGYDGFAARFPMNRVPGLLLTTPPNEAAGRLNHIIYFDRAAEAMHVRPAANGGLRLGADDTDGMMAEDRSAVTVRAAAARLLSRAKAQLSGVVGDVRQGDCDIAVGVRPYPLDGRTLAGALPGSQGLYVIATHSGVTLAPALGELMAEVMIDGSTPEALAPFSLDRFPGFG